MKFSENWLREWVALDATRDALCHSLTMAGLEVERVDALGAGLDRVVIAEVVAVAPHPNAAKLTVCEVAAGGDATLRIVCGAPNVRAGLKAPLATIGAVLPGGVAIRAVTLRGVESAGMLCSGRELGIDADGDGLMELPADAPVGAPLAAWLGLPDASIELSLTPNRCDCLGIRGLAREVAAEFGVAWSGPAMTPVTVGSRATLPVVLEAGADCPRYLGRIVEGFRADAATPIWIAERLRRAGLRPIGLLVDVTNYVMLELGQPLHAFDADRIAGGIVVRRASAGESLRLLDAREIALDPEFLVIADHQRPLALAGIIGGYDSRVTGATRRILLEAAHFAPSAISGRARRLGLHTDASHRFERGVDAELPRLALERASALLLEFAGGSVGPIVAAERPEALPERRPIRLRRSRLARVLGFRIDDAEVGAILTRLDLTVRADGDGWLATPPSHRFDLEIEEDLIEEVARIHGYDRIPTRLPRGELPPARVPESVLDVAELRQALAARDWYEAIAFAFVDPALLAAWGLADGAVAIANPLSSEQSVLRTSLLPGLVQSLQTNRRRQQSRVRLFEIGRSFHAGGEPRPQEVERLALVACGAAEAEQWGLPARALDFHDIKGEIEALALLRGAGEPIEIEAGGPSFLHPGQSARLRLGGREIGVIGRLNPALATALDLREPVHVAELALEPLRRRATPRARELSRFPQVRRDIAVVVDRQVPFAELARTIRAAAPEFLRDLVLFDDYRGKGLGPDERSLAIGLILQDDSRTLTDAEVDRAIAAIVAALAQRHGGRLR